MSNIGSEYSSHRRSVDEIEQDYQTQLKQAKKRAESREAKLVRSHENSMKTAQEKNTRSLENIRDQYESSAENRTEIDKAQRAKLEKQVYDRNGRAAQAAVSELKDQRDVAIRAENEARAKYASANEDVEDYYSRRAEAREKAIADKIEEMTEKHRKEITQAHERRDNGESNTEYREKLERDTTRAIAEARQDATRAKRQTLEVADRYETEIDNREKKNEAYIESALQTKDQKNRELLTKFAMSERASREKENSQLRDQVKDYSRLKAEVQKEKNLGRADAIREIEQDWMTQIDNQSMAHDAEKLKLKQDNQNLEKHLARTYDESLRDKEYRMATLLRNQNDDHAKMLEQTSSEYDRTYEHLKLQNQREKDLAQTRIETQRAELIDKSQKDLENQARIYQKTLSDQRLSDQTQVKNLERILNDVNTTEDPGRISSAAEASVRRQMEAKYEKSFQAEVERNRRAVDHLHTEYSARLSDARSDNHSQAANLNRANMLEQQQMKDTFISHVQDVEQNKLQMMTLANDQNEKSRETMQRMSERSTNEMRRHYEELIATRDLDAEVKYKTLLQESDFEKRTMRRDFSAQTSDLIRGYEKKLADQKLKYDEQLRDLKARTEAATRDNERRTKQALADQARSYDHRIAEMEAQQKDRARVAARNQEEEIEKVKRANALLLSKKG